MDWRTEIVELHDFFERYFLGDEGSIERFESVLDPGFTMIGPHGGHSNRTEVLEEVRQGHGHSESLVIVTSDHRLLTESDTTIVAEYIETHELADRSNRRWSTVVFVADPTTPNGVAWVRVHETWIPDET